MDGNKLNSKLVKLGHGGGLGGTESFTSARILDSGKLMLTWASLQTNVVGETDTCGAIMDEALCDGYAVHLDGATVGSLGQDSDKGWI